MIKTDKMGIIADDLTGSNDSGVQLTKKGLKASVIFDLSSSAIGKDDDVVVVDTDSRAISSKESYEVTREAALFLKDNGYNHIYKKVDSTLRGNLGYEIKAVVDVYKPDFCVIAPAFPRIGRETKQGVHYLNGTPIHETEISRDPKCPVTESYIPKLLQDQVQVEIGTINTKELGNNSEAWKEKLLNFKDNAITWIVFDVEEDSHLDWIADQVSKISKNIVWVGSAGLAEFLPGHLDLIQSETMEEVVLKEENILVVSGSLSGVTKTQIDRLLELQDIQGVEVNPLHVFEKEHVWTDYKVNYINQVLEAFKQGKTAVLFVDSSAENRTNTANKGKELQLSPSEISNKISNGLGEIASSVVMDHALVGGLVLTGGDTAKDVCRHIGVSGLQLVKEIEPGIPLGKLTADKELYTITKAGAFGQEHSLVRAVLELKGVNHYE